MPNLSQKIDGRQTQAITPRFQHAVRLLQLSALDYEQELREMTLRNPFLELEDNAHHPDAGDRDATAALAREVESSDSSESGPAGDGPQRSQDEWNSDSWLGSPMRDGARDLHSTALDLMPAATDVRQHLHAQADHVRLSPRDRALVDSV